MADKRLVGLWCAECEKVRAPDGTPVDGISTRRCGHDYGEGLTSHLDVVPLYVDWREKEQADERAVGRVYRVDHDGYGD